MKMLSACANCETLVRPDSCVCPGCGTTLRSCKTAGSTAGAAILGLALTGCIFQPQPKYGIADTGDTEAVDNDGDGFNTIVDCDDDNPDIHPEAEETPGDGIDSNCDGEDDT